MYDSDEEIRRKRRNLFIVIGIIILLILILVIFLLTRGSGKKKEEVVTGEITCELEVKNGVTPDSNGVYHQPVTVGFKSINAVSKKYEITKQTVGTFDNSRNKDTFTVSKTGTYHISGYVQDSAGHKGKCEVDINLSLTSPSCELDVVKGTLGTNGWYRSDVEVGFSSMDANNSSLSIVKYYIEKEVTALDPTDDGVKAEDPNGNIEKYTVKDNQVTTLIGHVFDGAGNEGTCTLIVKKDNTIPTCKLKVTSGTQNANGEYTDNPVIEFDEINEDISEIASSGVGLTKNYSQKSYTVTAEGKTTVVGFVKDKAGNEGTCSIEITRPTSTVPKPTTPATPTPTNSGYSKPSCVVHLSNIRQTDQPGVYTQEVKATLTFATTNGATIVDYGLAETRTYNKKTEIVISNNGTHTVYGIAKDSYGHVAECTTSQFVIDKGEYLYAKVQVGDYVAYDAGTWTETRTEQKIDGYYWGMQNGSAKQKGVKCDTNDTGTRDGWMVYNVVNQKVYLIHAGTPECIYHGRTTSDTVVNVMQSEAAKYVNSKYAEYATILHCNLPGFDCGATVYTPSIYTTGTHYWIAQNGDNNTLMSISPRGSKQPFNLKSFGLRPVVVLRSDVMTTGKSGSTWILK